MIEEKTEEELARQAAKKEENARRLREAAAKSRLEKVVFFGLVGWDGQEKILYKQKRRKKRMIGKLRFSNSLSSLCLLYLFFLIVSET